MRSSLPVLRLFLLLAGVLTTAAGRADVHPAQLLPDTTVSYLEIEQPAKLLAEVLEHPITHRVQSLKVFEEATRSEGYRNFLTGRKFFEIQIGSDWRTAIEALTARGIAAGLDATTQGGVVLIRGRDEATMENFRTKILELTRLAGGRSGSPESHRDVPVYRFEGGEAAVVRDWLIVCNNAELGRAVLDRAIDAGTSEPDEREAGTLASRDVFHQARATRSENTHVWGFGDLQAIRDAGDATKLFEGRAENPLAELLFGGIQSTIRKSPFFTLELTAARSGLTVRIQSPWRADWVPEERNYFFGPAGGGVAPSLPEVPGTLLTLSAWRDVSGMWLRAGDLFNEEMNDELAVADATLTTIFAGKDFGEEILGSFGPEIGLIVTRQDFTDLQPAPALKLPAFALMLKLRDAETMRPELRRTFQSAVGFLNIVGAQEGRPQLEMDMVREQDLDIITSHFVPDRKDKESTSAPVIYNFSPSAAFAGDRFVLSSTAGLARQLATTPAGPDLPPQHNTVVTVNADVVSQVLDDNREQLITQNMLQEGHSREEAEAAIGVLFEVLRSLKSAGLTLERMDDALAIRLNVDVHEHLEP